MKTFRLLTLLTLLTFTIFPAQSHALECNDSKAFVESVGNEVITLAKNLEINVVDKEIKLTEMFKRQVNIAWMGKFALGRSWNELKESQQKEYLSAYESYLINAYVPKFKDYNDQKIEVLSSTPLRKKNEHLVVTKLSTPGEPEIEITYRVKKDGACYKIHDIVAEGVSLINTQRQDFGSTYRSKGFDKLVALLKSKKSK